MTASKAATLSSDAAAAKAPLAPSAASSPRQADSELAGPAAAGGDLVAGTGSAEQACKSSIAAEAANAMEDDFLLVDMSVSLSVKQGEQKKPLSVEVNGMQVSTNPSLTQPVRLHAEPHPADFSLQGSMEAKPMELTPPVEHLSDSAGEQAQQHSSHQAQLFISHGQHLLSSRPQHRAQPEATHQWLQKAPPQSASGTSRQQPGRAVKWRCMVHVSLITIGPGTATEGATIVALTTEEASKIRGSLAHQTAPKEVSLLCWASSG